MTKETNTAITIKDIIFEYRRKHSMPQDQFAVDLSEIHGLKKTLDRTTISRWESGTVVPPNTFIPSLASLTGHTEEKITAALEEARRLLSNGDDVVVGNYELFQWSYLAKFIMKTNIKVYKNKKRLGFTEWVFVDKGSGIIEGTVSIEKPNLIFNGRGNRPFVECETIMIEIPRGNPWVYGIVLGVTSDRHATPTASRAVVHYLGAEEFSGAPKYELLDKIGLDIKYQHYLSMRIPGDWPILSSNFQKR